jgi:hypothetical protein
MIGTNRTAQAAGWNIFRTFFPLHASEEYRPDGDTDMFATPTNPIVAIAAQAKTAEDRAVAARLLAERIERDRADSFRRRANAGRATGARTLPAVATIH